MSSQKKASGLTPEEQLFLTRLYLDYKPLMVSTVKRYLSNQGHQEDILQDAMVRFIRNIKTVRKVPSNALSTYIVYTVKAAALDFLKKEKHKSGKFVAMSDESFTQLPDDSLPLDELLQIAEQKDALYGIWNDLSESEQFLLSGKYILGYSDEELSSVMKCKPDSIRMMLTRARRRALKLIQMSGKDFQE